MKRLFATLMSMAVFALYIPLAEAQSANCPPEVAKATEMLSQKGGVARGQDTQAPRSLAGARTQDQAPRGQDTQAPRGQDTQAPRGQATQAPADRTGGRGQDVQAPRGQATQDRTGGRGQDVQAPRGQATQDRTGGRGQDVQAPRGQDTQDRTGGRGQDVQAPRSLAGSKASGSNVSKASSLIKEAEAACKAGDMKTAKSKADAAMAALK